MAGTTVHDDGLVLECFDEAARAVGLFATREELNERMGLSKKQVFQEFAARQLGAQKEIDALAEQGYQLFRRILEGAYERGGVRPVKGAEEFLKWCRGQGVRVALNTGFYREVTEIIVRKLGWGSAVDAVVCVDDVKTGRPAPFMIFSAMERCGVENVREVIVVGDTPSDLLAGTNAGAAAVLGVTSGAHSAASLRRFPHTALIDGIWELPDVLKRLDRLNTKTEKSWSRSF